MRCAPCISYCIAPYSSHTFNRHILRICFNTVSLCVMPNVYYSSHFSFDFPRSLVQTIFKKLPKSNYLIRFKAIFFSLHTLWTLQFNHSGPTILALFLPEHLCLEMFRMLDSSLSQFVVCSCNSVVKQKNFNVL